MQASRVDDTAEILTPSKIEGKDHHEGSEIQSKDQKSDYEADYCSNDDEDEDEDESTDDEVYVFRYDITENEKRRNITFYRLIRGWAKSFDLIRQYDEIRAQFQHNDFIRNAPELICVSPNYTGRLPPRTKLCDMPTDRLLSFDHGPPGDTELHRITKTGKFGVGRDMEQIPLILETIGVNLADKKLPVLFEKLGVGKEHGLYQLVFGKLQPKVLPESGEEL